MPDNATPIAADDAFTADQDTLTTSICGNLGADNGLGLDYDPDGTLLGWAGVGFNPVGDGDRYLGAVFSNGTLGFLSIQGTVSYPFPVFFSTLLLFTHAGGQVFLHTDGSFTDSNGDALTVTSRTVVTAHGGIVTLLANGDFVYVPPTITVPTALPIVSATCTGPVLPARSRSHSGR